jgi:predicted Zn-dependent protease
VGYIYVTRGILAHFDNEAELVSVLGHEIGHVTARHGANQMSKAQLAQVGLQFGAAMTPQNLQSLVDLAGAGVGILFLQFSRDDERQADDLGLRYVVRTHYDPRQMGNVFLTLKRVSEAEGHGGSIPNWMQTHPDPENREERITEEIDAMDTDFSGSTVNRDRYLERIDGLIYGNDPRQGYFKDNVLYHPEMKFRLDFPAEWKRTNTRQYVVAMSPQEDAMIQLVLAREDTSEGAMRAFLEQGGVANANPSTRTIHGLTALGTSFTATLSQGQAAGEVAFIEYDGKVFQILGIAGEAKWNDVRGPVADSLASFRPLTDSRMLDVEPQQIRIVRPGSAMDLEELARRFGATVPVKTLSVINGVDPGDRLEVGRAYKVVRGGKLP